MTPMPKPETYRSEKYLKWIRSRPCPYCCKRSEPHHIRRSYWGAGTSQKPHDFVAVPRCRDHHGPDFEDGVEREIIGLMIEYIVSSKGAKP